MRFGYMRISTESQDFGRQEMQLEKYGCDRIFKDIASGAKTNRSGLNRMLEMLRPGDTVVVVKLSRIGRSVKHLIELITYFQKEKIEFISLTESIDTSSAIGKLVFTILAALAEFERELIVERTKGGLEAARKKGMVIGRPKGITRRNQVRAVQLHALHHTGEYTVKEVMEMLKIGSTTTYYKHLHWYEEKLKEKKKRSDEAS